MERTTLGNQFERSKPMTNMINSAVARVMSDRKAVTALEYALIASAVVLVVIVAYNAMFGRLTAFVNGITFTGK